MKYTDQEIIDKFSNVDYDKNNCKQLSIFNRVVQKNTRRTFMIKKKPLLVTAAVAIIVVPTVLIFSGRKDPLDQYIIGAPWSYVETAQAPREIFAAADVEVDSSVLTAADSLSALKIARTTRPVYRGALSAGPNFNLPLLPLAQNTKDYVENAFKVASLEPLSTFSADVDTASYTMLRKQINEGFDIQKEAVRLEALINNFPYSYTEPQGKDPMAVSVEYSSAPWNKENQLVKIGVKARKLNREQMPKSNIVFLIDVSGSMYDESRLPLVKKSLKMLLEQLPKDARISIVTYASGVEVKLDGVKVSNKEKIIKALDNLEADGATSGEEGLKKAYEVAKKNFIRKGNNRIVIASDGDFNVGSSNAKEFEKQLAGYRESGVFISVMGFGMGNYRDDLMETIADKGNGNYVYIDDLKAAQKALVREFGSTMFTVAKDVKFQVEFNPAYVQEYRLIGYEKRQLNNADFNDDTKDAGEVGSGHTVTVLYEIRPKTAQGASVDPLKYSQTTYNNTEEVLTVKVRYKEPNGDTSKLISETLKVKDFKPFEDSSDDFRFASAAAAFGQLVKESPFKGNISAKEIAQIATQAKGIDDGGDRAEFVQLVRTYDALPKADK